MRMSDLVAQYILEMLEEQNGSAEIQRNELAGNLGCVPSQINYVITSRFTPEQGYIVESRRGGGGFIRISRVKMDKGTALMHIVNSVGERLDKTIGTEGDEIRSPLDLDGDFDISDLGLEGSGDVFPGSVTPLVKGHSLNLIYDLGLDGETCTHGNLQGDTGMILGNRLGVDILDLSGSGSQTSGNSEPGVIVMLGADIKAECQDCCHGSYKKLLHHSFIVKLL